MKVIFGAAISIVLLAIYVYLVQFGIDVSVCVSDDACTKLTAESFNDRMASSLALIGGLVSALVIAELSVTKPGEVPTERLLANNLPVMAKTATRVVTGIYLLVWLFTGVAAFFYGYLAAEPGVMPALADLGQAWLGIAVGAGYAYFGIKPKA